MTIAVEKVNDRIVMESDWVGESLTLKMVVGKATLQKLCRGWHLNNEKELARQRPRKSVFQT